VPTRPRDFGPAGRTFRKPRLIDEPLGFAQSCGVDEDYILLFRCGLEEIATRPGQARCRESVATNYEPHVRVFVRVAE
jgi:hypothetical protein